MVIKRKRSDSDFGSFNSTVEPSSFNFDAIAAMDTARRGFFSARISTPSHIHSRTMKRFRDNRPSEELVHQRTLNLLYSAQQQHNQPSNLTPEISVTPTPVAPQTPLRTTQTSGPQQRSLHSFWNLPSSSSSSVNSSPSRNASSPPPAPMAVQQVSNDLTACEDCGACLRATNNESDGDIMMDVDMDIDGSGNACGACGKAVCFGCSVSNLGENRRCLVCAGREGETRNGSGGWMTSVNVF
ncbi:hypothetical protein QBC44DRAFT_326966 [Cladorrhinum sp. PSN332]|nr:hypothetical protein QBC44DRAFT_326966 [Cladorrhinum sp. PSN332]